MMPRRLAAVLVLTAFSAARAAGPAALELPGDKPVLIVVHPAYFPEADLDGKAKDGINEAVRLFKAKGWPVVYVVDCERGKNYAEGQPSATVCSNNGMHAIQVRNPDVFLAGGQYNGCLNRASKAVAAAAGFPLVFSKDDMSLLDEDKKQLVSMAARGGAGAPDRLTLHYIRDALYARPMPDFSQSLKSAPVETLLSFDPQIGMPLGAGFTASLPPVWKTLDADVEMVPESGPPVALAKAGKPGARKLTIRFITLESLGKDGGGPPAETRRQPVVSSALELLKSLRR